MIVAQEVISVRGCERHNDINGGGFIADYMSWRNSDVSASIINRHVTKLEKIFMCHNSEGFIYLLLRAAALLSS